MIQIERGINTIVEKGWGRELWVDNNEEYCGKILELKKGSKFSLHYHLKKRETFLIYSGTIRLNYFNLENADSESKILTSYDVVKIPRGAPHQIEALEDSVIIEFSTHHEDSDSYRIGKGNSQLNKKEKWTLI